MAFCLSMSVEFYEKMKAAAKNKGMKISEYIRYCVLKDIEG